ncbi:hypothetical protein N806_29810 [Rhodococcus sp. P27]|nr:hypothetical protein N806_29810 [Rhodococcus sp. P27]
MDNQEFFDRLYQSWADSGTDGWIVSDTDEDIVLSMSDSGETAEVALGVSPDIAAFIAAAHGVIPELIERAMSALDESDRLDIEKDELIGQIMQLEIEIDSLKRQLEERDA